VAAKKRSRKKKSKKKVVIQSVLSMKRQIIRLKRISAVLSKELDDCEERLHRVEY
jgi:hypothetical protein